MSLCPDLNSCSCASGGTIDYSSRSSRCGCAMATELWPTTKSWRSMVRPGTTFAGTCLLVEGNGHASHDAVGTVPLTLTFPGTSYPAQSYERAARPGFGCW